MWRGVYCKYARGDRCTSAKHSADYEYKLTAKFVAVTKKNVGMVAQWCQKILLLSVMRMGGCTLNTKEHDLILANELNMLNKARNKDTLVFII